MVRVVKVMNNDLEGDSRMSHCRALTNIDGKRMRLGIGYNSMVVNIVFCVWIIDSSINVCVCVYINGRKIQMAAKNLKNSLLHSYLFYMLEEKCGARNKKSARVCFVSVISVRGTPLLPSAIPLPTRTGLEEGGREGKGKKRRQNIWCGWGAS